MRIRFVRDCVYPQLDPAASRAYRAGQVYDLPDDHAQRWLRRGAAVIADDPRPGLVERAPEPEKKPAPEKPPKTSKQPAKE
jgi:hypothetical protein